MKVIPLALFIPGLLAKKLRAYQWLCFLIMIYFIQAILDIFSADRRVQGILETVLISLLYSAAIHFTHGKLKHLKKKMKQAPLKKGQE